MSKLITVIDKALDEGRSQKGVVEATDSGTSSSSASRRWSESFSPLTATNGLFSLFSPTSPTGRSLSDTTTGGSASAGLESGKPAFCSLIEEKKEERLHVQTDDVVLLCF